MKLGKTTAINRHQMLEYIACWMYADGSSNTLSGNYIYTLEEVHDKFGIDLAQEDCDDLVQILSTMSVYIIEAMTFPENGVAADINFSTIFTEGADEE